MLSVPVKKIKLLSLMPVIQNLVAYFLDHLYQETPIKPKRCITLQSEIKQNWYNF